MFSAATSIYILLLQFLELMILSRYISVIDFGKLASCTITLGLVALLGNGVLSQIFLRRDAQRLPSSSRTLILLAIIQSALASLVIFKLYPLVPNGFLVAGLIFLIVFSRMIYACMESVCLRAGQIRRVNYSLIVAYTIGFCSAMVLLIYFDVNGFFVLLISLAIREVSLSSLLFCPGHLGSRSVRWTCEIRYFIKAIMFYRGFFSASLFSYALNNLDKWFVGLAFGLQNLGFYNRGLQLIQVPISILNRVLSRDVQSGMLRNDKNYRKTLPVLLGLALVAALIFFAFPDLVVRAVLGDQWQLTARILEVVCWLVILKVFLKIVDVWIRAVSSDRLYSFFYQYQLVILVMVWFFLAPGSVIEFAGVILLSSLLSSLVALAFLVKRKAPENNL